MSDLFPKITSDEIELDEDAQNKKREEEIKLDKPPHHED